MKLCSASLAEPSRPFSWHLVPKLVKIHYQYSEIYYGLKYGAIHVAVDLMGPHKNKANWRWKRCRTYACGALNGQSFLSLMILLCVNVPPLCRLRRKVFFGEILRELHAGSLFPDWGFEWRIIKENQEKGRVCTREIGPAVGKHRCTTHVSRMGNRFL